MSETETAPTPAAAEVKERGSVTRWYRDGDDVVARLDGAEVERRSIYSFTSQAKLIVEGYITHRLRGLTHEEIVDGGKLPDRSMPAGAVKKPSKADQWREALAHAVAEEETKAGFVGVAREAKEAALVDGRAYAKSLSDADLRDAQSRSAVISWFAKLYGAKGPLRTKAPALQVAAE